MPIKKIEISRKKEQFDIVIDNPSRGGLEKIKIDGHPVTFRGFKDYGFFVHHPPRWNFGQGRTFGPGWVVSEVTSGYAVTQIPRQTRTAATEAALALLRKNGKQALAKAVKQAKKLAIL